MKVQHTLHRILDTTTMSHVWLEVDSVGVQTITESLVKANACLNSGVTRVAINVAPADLADPDSVKAIVKLAERFPFRLVTELRSDRDVDDSVTAELIRAGTLIALDNLGDRADLSLKLLAVGHVRILKLAASVMARAYTGDAAALQFVCGMHALATTMDCQLVIQGVDRQFHLDLLGQLGLVDCLQGELFPATDSKAA